MTSIEWNFFWQAMVLTFLFGASMIACAEQAGPTPIQRQLELCQIDNANLKAALAECASK